MDDTPASLATVAIDEIDRCFVCETPFSEGDPVYYSEGGYMHAGCCGLERDSFYSVDAPLQPGQPIPRPQIWNDLVAPMPDAPDEVNDRVCVDRFAAEMKSKLGKARASGRSGWDDPSRCSMTDLSQMLVEHVAKGDPIDVANFAMMIQQRGGRIEIALQDAVEIAARHLFEIMPHEGPIGSLRPVWSDGGNTPRHAEARRYARAALGSGMNQVLRPVGVPAVADNSVEAFIRHVEAAGTAFVDRAEGTEVIIDGVIDLAAALAVAVLAERPAPTPAPQPEVLGRREADAVVIPGTSYDDSLPIHHQRSRSLRSLDDIGGSPEATSFDDAANITHSRLDDFNPSMLSAIDNDSDFTPHSVLHPQLLNSIVEQARNVEASPHTNVDVQSEIERVVQSVNEWDDRTSPDDYPEHLLITSKELSDILRSFAATLEGK